MSRMWAKGLGQRRSRTMCPTTGQRGFGAADRSAAVGLQRPTATTVVAVAKSHPEVAAQVIQFVAHRRVNRSTFHGGNGNEQGRRQSGEPEKGRSHRRSDEARGMGRHFVGIGPRTDPERSNLREQSRQTRSMGNDDGRTEIADQRGLAGLTEARLGLAGLNSTGLSQSLFRSHQKIVFGHLGGCRRVHGIFIRPVMSPKAGLTMGTSHFAAQQRELNSQSSTASRARLGKSCHHGQRAPPGVGWSAFEKRRVVRYPTGP